jgi:hypothetical protein
MAGQAVDDRGAHGTQPGVTLVPEPSAVVKRAIARGAPFAALFTIVFIIMGFVQCSGFVLLPLGALAIGYLTTTRMPEVLDARSPASLAPYVGAGVGVTMGLAFFIATAVGYPLASFIAGLVEYARNDAFVGFHGTPNGIPVAVWAVAGSLIGCIVGFAFAWLGSSFACNRATPPASSARPF